MKFPIPRVQPHIAFNGNCGEAIKFYEKVFGAKAQVFRYKDAPPDPNWPVPAGREEWVMQACIEVSEGMKFQFCDCDQQGANAGTNICLQLTYGTPKEITQVYNALIDGGKELCKLGKQFWAQLYGELIDKFGIRWSVISEEAH